MVEIQKAHGGTHDMFFFVPDLHSFTTPIDHNTLYEHTLRNLKYFVAAGMDFWADGAYLYRQSYIPAHAELAWILNCFAYMGEMSRMTQYKDKSEGQSNVSVGLFNYPILMAADILLYSARYVPVGEDQRQHLELTRDLAMRINNKFADVFPEGVFATVPEDWKAQLAFAQRDNGVRIRSLRNPEKKMSKSVDDPAGTINMTDNPGEAAKKVMSATTDSLGKISFDWENQPGISNLLQIQALLSERPVRDVAAEWEGKNSYGELKKAVADQVEAFLANFQERVKAVDEPALLAKLQEDEHIVSEFANASLLRVQQAVGLRPRP